MNFINSEGRRRHNLVDGAIGLTIKLLQDNMGVQKHFTHRERERLLRATRRMFIPNISSDGTVHIPRRYQRTDAVAVVGLTRGQSLRAGRGFNMTPTQEARVTSKVADLEPKPPLQAVTSLILRQAREKIEAEQGQVIFAEPRNSLRRGVMHSLSAHIVLEPGKFNNMGPYRLSAVYGRPVVGLLVDPFDDELTWPAALVHENTHAEQWRNRPMVSAQAGVGMVLRYQDELGAYHAAARLEGALYNSDDPDYGGNSAILHDSHVEAVRVAHADPRDPFAATPAMLRQLAAIGLEI